MKRPVVFHGRCRDEQSLVHGTVLTGHGFDEFEMVWCSGRPANDLEYEDRDQLITCIACAAERTIE